MYNFYICNLPSVIFSYKESMIYNSAAVIMNKNDIEITNSYLSSLRSAMQGCADFYIFLPFFSVVVDN